MGLSTPDSHSGTEKNAKNKKEPRATKEKTVRNHGERSDRVPGHRTHPRPPCEPLLPLARHSRCRARRHSSSITHTDKGEHVERDNMTG